MRSRIREPDGGSRRCGRDQQRPGGRARWLWCAWCCLALWWKSEEKITFGVNKSRKITLRVFFCLVQDAGLFFQRVVAFWHHKKSLKGMSMRVSRKFIEDTVMSYHASFSADKNWCNISALAPVNTSYAKRKYQKIYALRFIPAYYFEYCALASLLRSRLNALKIKDVKIASFGCGLCPDYYALEENLLGIDFEYVGFDRVHWSTQDLMPAKGDNFSFRVELADGLDEGEIDDFDVFIFPKSIRDIADSDDEALVDLARSLSGSPKKRIFFMNSFVCTKGQRSLDTPYFTVIHDALLEAGFSCQDDHKETFYRKKPGSDKSYAALISINNNFVYPGQGFVVCPERGSMDDCETCNVVKRPIFSNEFMDYQLLEYVKE